MSKKHYVLFSGATNQPRGGVKDDHIISPDLDMLKQVGEQHISKELPGTKWAHIAELGTLMIILEWHSPEVGWVAIKQS